MRRLNGNKLNVLVEGVAVKLVVLMQFNGGKEMTGTSENSHPTDPC